jgi:sterol desaturase/sphingolipid hydroxylase (fatty acid hydroxylase superfamily)
MDECVFLIYSSFTLHFLTYWIFGGIFLLTEKYKSEWINQYKIQSIDKNKDKNLVNVIKNVIFNQTIVSFIFVYFIYNFFNFFNMNLQYGEYPDFKTIITHFLVYFTVEEVLFYYSHRLLHHPSIYGYIHKKHHEWKTPICITAVYCHPVEHMISNLLPIFVGPFIMNSHISLLWIWIFMATLNTLNSHSGYNLPFLFSNESHNYHHLVFNRCYGIFGFLDIIHSTNH